MTYVVKTIDVYGKPLLIVFETIELYQAFKVYELFSRGGMSSVTQFAETYEEVCSALLEGRLS